MEGEKKNMLKTVLDFVGQYYDGSWKDAKYVDKKISSLPIQKLREMYELALSYFKLEEIVDSIAEGYEYNSDSEDINQY